MLSKVKPVRTMVRITFTRALRTPVWFYDEETDTTKYTAKLRVGMKFSDGVEVTADDIIFTYYTFLDPSYIGSTSLASFDIVGLKDYQTQTTSEVFDKYETMFTLTFTPLALIMSGPQMTLDPRTTG